MLRSRSASSPSGRCSIGDNLPVISSVAQLSTAFLLELQRTCQPLKMGQFTFVVPFGERQLTLEETAKQQPLRPFSELRADVVAPERPPSLPCGALADRLHGSPIQVMAHRILASTGHEVPRAAKYPVLRV